MPLYILQLSQKNGQKLRRKPLFLGCDNLMFYFRCIALRQYVLPYALAIYAYIAKPSYYHAQDYTRRNKSL